MHLEEWLESKNPFVQGPWILPAFSTCFDSLGCGSHMVTPPKFHLGRRNTGRRKKWQGSMTISFFK